MAIGTPYGSVSTHFGNTDSTSEDVTVSANVNEGDLVVLMSYVSNENTTAPFTDSTATGFTHIGQFEPGVNFKGIVDVLAKYVTSGEDGTAPTYTVNFGYATPFGKVLMATVVPGGDINGITLDLDTYDSSTTVTFPSDSQDLTLHVLGNNSDDIDQSAAFPAGDTGVTWSGSSSFRNCGFGVSGGATGSGTFTATAGTFGTIHIDELQAGPTTNVTSITEDAKIKPSGLSAGVTVNVTGTGPVTQVDHRLTRLSDGFQWNETASAFQAISVFHSNTAPNDATPYDHTITELPDTLSEGEAYSLAVRATDVDGTGSWSTRSFEAGTWDYSDEITITAADTGNVLPTVAVTSHADQERHPWVTGGLYLDGLVHLAGTATDSNGTVSAVEVRSRMDAVTWSSWGAATNTGTNFSTWTYDVAGVTEGASLDLEVRAYDGTDYSATIALTLYINKRPHNAGTITSPTDAQVLPANSSHPDVTVTGVDDDAGPITRFLYRIQRLSDSAWWNQSSQVWQATAVYNTTDFGLGLTVPASYTFRDGFDGVMFPQDLGVDASYTFQSLPYDADDTGSTGSLTSRTFSTGSEAANELPVIGSVTGITNNQILPANSPLPSVTLNNITDDTNEIIRVGYRLQRLSDGLFWTSGQSWAGQQRDLSDTISLTVPGSYVMEDGKDGLNFPQDLGAEETYIVRYQVSDADNAYSDPELTEFTFSTAAVVGPPPGVERTIVADDYIPRHVATPTVAGYRALFGDVRTGQILGELPITALAWGDVLNGAGTVTATIPIVQPNPTITPGSLAPRETTLWVEENGEYVMGGILLTTAISGDSMTLAATGFFDYLRRRTISNTRKYNGVDQLAIAQELAGVYGGPVGVSYYTPGSGVLRDRNWYWWESKNVGEEISRLAATEDGFDFRFIYPRDVDNSPRIVFETLYPATGTDTGLILEHERKGVTVLGYEQDAVDVTNTAITVGAGNDKDTVRHIGVSNEGLARYVPLETVFTHSSVINQATLVEHAGRHLARTSKPIARAKVKVVSHEHGPVGYKTGDIATVRANVGLMNLDRKMRIMSMNVTYQGTMRIASLDLVGVEVFS